MSAASVLLADKDAEIERLKAENEVTVSVCNENTDLKKLITELCEALEWWEKQGNYAPEFATKLIQRGREATR